MSIEQTARKLTRDEFKKKVKSDRKNLEKEHRKLYNRLVQLESHEHVYPENIDIEIKGSLFADFINNIAHRKNDLEKIKANLLIMVDTIDYMLNDNAHITIELMKAHIKNIEGGYTRKESEIEEVPVQK